MTADQIPTIKLQAQSLIDVGRLQEAAELLTRALSVAPNDGELLCLMSQVLLSAGALREANAYAERALAVSPENSWAHRLRSISLRQHNRHESLKSAQEAVRLEPYDPWCWYCLAGAQLHVFNLEEASIAAERLRTLAPEWPLSHQVLSLVALKKEDWRAAESHSRRELELDPNSYAGLNNLGVALLNQGKKRESIDFFNRAAKLNPQAPLARNNINAAVKKYLPRISIPVLALFWSLNGLRVVGQKGIVPLVAVLSFLGLLGGIFLLIRWNHFRKLPIEVKNYVRFTRKSKRPAAGRAILRVTYMIGVAGAALAIFFWGITYYKMFTDDEVNGTIIEFIFPLLMILTFSGSLFGLLSLSRRRSQSNE